MAEPIIIDWGLATDPAHIDGNAAFRAGQTLTNEELNNYLNTLIFQGNYNMDWIEHIVEKLPELVTAINTTVADLETDYDTMLTQTSAALETAYGIQTETFQPLAATVVPNTAHGFGNIQTHQAPPNLRLTVYI